MSLQKRSKKCGSLRTCWPCYGGHCKTQHSILTNDSTKSDLRTFTHRDDFEIFGSTPTWVFVVMYKRLSAIIFKRNSLKNHTHFSFSLYQLAKMNNHLQKFQRCSLKGRMILHVLNITNASPKPRTFVLQECCCITSVQVMKQS